MKNVNIYPPPPLQFLKIVYLLFVGMGFAQTPPDFYHSPGGLLDQTFDRFGKSYTLSQIHIPSTNVVSTETTNKFILHFEDGSGMEDPNNSIHIARKNVLVAVLTDIENFMKLPISNTKVNLWIRALEQATATPNVRLGLGSSVYNVSMSNTGKIVDGAVWKTLSSGTNAYQNVVISPNDYYHGILAFNFSTFFNHTLIWHTDLSTTPSSGRHDLYSAMLKEVIHTLGLTSLMNAEGKSVFGEDYKYYSRYDTKLKNNPNTHSLLINSGSVWMYNWVFNPNLSLNILRPGCALPEYTNPSTVDNTTCAHALKYVGSVTLPIYTPICFEVGNSLSYFEDQRYPNCSTPYGNNFYFVMSNRNNGVSVKRYPKPEERLVLLDIGYSLEDEYGSASTHSCYFEYDTSHDPEPIDVVGRNDGINTDLTYTFYGDVNENLMINGAQLLSNDLNANTFEGLQVVNSTATLSTTTGDSTTSIIFNSAEGGLHVLQYVPKNGNISGNITYVYVYLRYGNHCGVADDCNLVINGDFEQLVNNVPPDNHSQAERACNWQNYTITADYFHALSPNINYGVPINYYGNRLDNISENQAYVGFRHLNSQPEFGGFGETLRTELSSPLVAEVQYQLSFDVSKSDIAWAQNCSLPMQAFLTTQDLPPTTAHFLYPWQLEEGIHLIGDNIIESNDWTTITFNFQALGGERYLYLGGISVSNLVGGDGNFTFYYLDNVSLLELENVTEAVDDSFTFSQSTNSQTSAISVLNNDHSGGQPFSPPYNGVTITQLSTTSPNISINATGHVVVAANTTNGTYTLTYSFTGACSESDIATVTVVVSDTDVVFDVAEKYRQMDKCFESDVSFFNFDFFNPENWDGIGFLINSLPLNNSLATVEVFGNPLPNGFTLNPNGIMTVPANYYDEIEFYIIFRSTQNPSATSMPIRCNFTIRPFGIAGSDVRVFNLHTQSFFGISLISTSNNLLINDIITDCPNPEINFVQATSSNCIVEVTNNPHTNLFSINQSGILSVTDSPNVTPLNEPYIVRYRICHPTTPGICSEEVEVWIGVIDLE